ncbi:MAG: hypothetical protein H6R00_1565 [Proteobacteria bacterium]|nr:hypothetical protein [Pseudomonadota bacterium]
MRPDSFDADRFDAIVLANRQRHLSVVEAFDLTPHMRRVILEELEPGTPRPARPAEWIKLYGPLSCHGRNHG